MSAPTDDPLDTNQTARQRAAIFQIVEEYEAAREQSRREMAGATERVRGLESQVVDYRNSLDALRSEITMMKASKSWRMTGPIRGVVGNIRRVLRCF